MSNILCWNRVPTVIGLMDASSCSRHPSSLRLSVFTKGLGLFFLFSLVTRYNKHISLGDFISVSLWTQIPQAKDNLHVLRRFFLTYIYMFKIYIYWLHWVFIAACGHSLVAVSRASLVVVQGTYASVVEAYRLNSCGTWS